MPQTPNTRSGGQVLADALYAHGVELAYCVAGESYLELLDALYDYRDRIRLVTCRQEGGAANMAEAYGKLTGKPGVVMVTRGPGACHAAIGCHTAFQDSTPMVMLVGQVARDQMDREAFQEIDYRRMFGQVAKWVAQIETADRIPEYIARAFHTATSGRPGPVVLALPEDMLRDHVAVADAARYQTVRANPGPADLETLRGMLAEAERPLMLVGGGGWSDAAAADIVAFAEANDIPTLCSFRRLDIFDNNHKNFCGDLSTGSNPKVIEAFKSSDLLVVVGARLGEITTQGYTLMSIPDPGRKLVHIHADSDELGRVFQPTLAIQSGMAQFAAAAKALQPVDASRRTAWTEARRADYEAWTTIPEYGGDLDLGACMKEVRKRLAADGGVVTVDAGNFSGWPMRFLKYDRKVRFAGPTSGAMGYSVPAACSASLTFKDKLVLGFVGDGGFMMAPSELATAGQYGGKPVMLVFNNGMYGTIRAHQARHHPGRPIAIELVNPDFAALIRAYGGHGETVKKTEEFGPALDRAIASGRPAIIELQMDPDVIGTTTTLTKMEAASRAAAAKGS